MARLPAGHAQPAEVPRLGRARSSTDGSSARPLVEGTVARGTLQDDEAFFTGKNGDVAVKELPFAVDEAVLNRGQERFNIYCTPCHDKTGGGNGMVVQRGFRQPPSYHIDRLRQADAGYFFDVMTNGFGAMPDYRAQIAPRDRWAIVAYIRALQLSQHAPPADVPGGDPTKVPQPAAGERGAGETLRSAWQHTRSRSHRRSGAWPRSSSGPRRRHRRPGRRRDRRVLNVDQFLRSWLIGFLFCLGLSLGSLALLMLQHMSGGQWGLVGRRVFEAATRNLPFVALMFVPVLLRHAGALRVGAAGSGATNASSREGAAT